MSSRSTTASRKGSREAQEISFWCLDGDTVSEKAPETVFNTISKDIKNGKEGTLVILNACPTDLKDMFTKLINVLKPEIRVGCVARLGIITNRKVIIPVSNHAVPFGADLKAAINGSAGIEINPYDPTLEVEPAESMIEFIADMYERSGLITRIRSSDFDSTAMDTMGQEDEGSAIDPVVQITEGMHLTPFVLSIEVQNLCAPAIKPETLQFPYESLSVSSSHLYLLFSGISLPENAEPSLKVIRPQEANRRAIEAFDYFVTYEARDATYVCGCRRETSALLDKIGRLLHNKRRLFLPSAPIFYRITEDNAVDIKKDMCNLSEETKYIAVYTDDDQQENNIDSLETRLADEMKVLEEEMANVTKEKEERSKELESLSEFVNRKFFFDDNKTGPVWEAIEKGVIENDEAFLSAVMDFYTKVYDDLVKKEEEEAAAAAAAAAAAEAEAEAEAEAAKAQAPAGDAVAENNNQEGNAQESQAPQESPAEENKGEDAPVEPQTTPEGENVQPTPENGEEKPAENQELPPAPAEGQEAPSGEQPAEAAEAPAAEQPAEPAAEAPADTPAEAPADAPEAPAAE